MSRRHISELVQNDATRLALECEKKGLEALKESGGTFDSTGVLFIGLCQIVFELRAKIEKMKQEKNDWVKTL